MSGQRTILKTRVAFPMLAILSMRAGPAFSADPAAGIGDAEWSIPAPTAAENSEPAALQEVIVTAQKRSERALDVPASLTVVGSEDLARGGEVSNLNLTYFVPGLKMDRTGTDAAPALRGVTSLVASPGLDPNVATYIDGVYVSDTGAIIDLPDVRSVEVLKGPQGTLFGRNATGGAIQITTLKPSFVPTGSATVSYGRFNDQSVKAFLSGPLMSDQLAGSLSLYEETNEGYLHDVVNDSRTGRLSAQQARAKLLYTPTENAQFTLSAYYARHSDPAGAYGTPALGATAAHAQPGAIIPTQPYDVASNRPAINLSRGTGVSLNGAIQTDPGTLTVIAAYDKHQTAELNPAYAAYAPAGGFFYDDTQRDESESAELDFASNQYGPFNYIVGLYFYHDMASYAPVRVVSDAPPFTISIFGDQGDTSYAGFGEVNYAFTDRLTATAGVRYSTEHRTISGTSAFGSFASAPGPKEDFGDATFSSWTPRVSLRYALTSDTNAYFTFSQGFKSGGYETAAVFGNTAPLTPVRPEKLTAYEVGIKSSLAHGTSINASTFYYKYKDQQVSAFVNRGGVVLGETLNAAASTIYGVDLEGAIQVTDGLNLHTGISWLHARFDSFPAAVVLVPNYQNVGGVLVPIGNSQISEDVKGNELPRAPDWTVSVGGDYVKDFPAGTLTVKADVFRSDKFYFDSGNVFSQPAYTNLDASVAWQLPKGHWTFTVWGRNLTDDAITLGSFLTATSAAYNWAPPRTYGIALSTKF